MINVSEAYCLTITFKRVQGLGFIGPDPKRVQGLGLDPTSAGFRVLFLDANVNTSRRNTVSASIQSVFHVYVNLSCDDSKIVGLV